MADAVLDSFALLAFLRGEDGDGKVFGLLAKGIELGRPVHMCEVNYAEVMCITLRKNGARRWMEIASQLPALPLRFHPASRSLAEAAGDFKSRFKMSLADAFAASLAKELKAELVTGDPEFKPLEKELKIKWLR
jgi:PIN domain nuclease of toxin-antitoxin system